MERFGLYAQYYDLLYQDKDYVSEAKYVDELLKSHGAPGSNLLNMGCGTGKHDYALAGLGYNITGVDLSADMISQALNNIPAPLSDKLTFITGDIRTLDAKATFNAVISLFHVMSYQVTNEDLSGAINTAYRLLDAGGIFLFDCWYGPGVLTDKPSIRIKRMGNENIKITRLAESVLNSVENTVDVNYTILINPTNSREFTEIKETHKMRYLFVKEIELLTKNKFELLEVSNWLSRDRPGPDAWNAVFVLKKIL